MSTQDFKRKLISILSADVKGYSRLMGEDEIETVRTITTYREVISALIQQHRGRVVDSSGDNVLAEFASVVDAVKCAVEIQKEIEDRNAELSDNRRMEFRIGINLGDVVEKEERIYGDGVNIAARVEVLAEGGGICITRSVYDQVKKILNLGYEYLGEYDVKNISEPVRVYRVLMDPEAAGKVVGEKRTGPVLTEKPVDSTIEHDVFISYAAENKSIAGDICATLEGKKIRCWMAPRDVLPGVAYAEAIVDAINECQLLVLIFSSHANVSPYVKRELERAVSKGKPIIPFRIEDVPLAKEIELFVSSTHWLDAFTPPLHKHLECLAETVQLLLSKTRKDESKIIAEEKTKVAFPKKDKKNWPWLGIAAGILILLAILLWGYPDFLKVDTGKYENIALAHYNDGNFEQALKTCKAIADKNPQVRLIYLIRGNIDLRNGKLDEAKTSYHKGLQVKKGTDMQKAEVFSGLGRIASIQKQSDKSLGYYKQATDVAPESSQGYLSQAIILEDRKEYDAALALLEKAQKLAPKNQVIAAFTKETQKKVSLDQDQKKQERIDKLVKELLESMKSPSVVLPSDGWTSLPLTLWIMDFKTQGYSLQEGEERLLGFGITDQVLQQGSVQVVERALFDKVLQELKLGTSKLIDRGTALSVGKILAARLILSGQLAYSESQTQASIRLIETETGRITAAVNESFGSAITASAMADSLTKKLLERILKLYPHRGRISKINGKEANLNIGQKVGVRKGQRFRVVDENVTLEIISTRQDSSLAKIEEGEERLKEGLRVEAISGVDPINSDS